MVPQKLNQLQFLRFIAFFFVFTLHANRWTSGWFNITNFCMCSISFFFILSGFTTGYSSYHKNYDGTWDEVKNLLKKRIKRIYPLYLFVNLLSLCFFEIFPASIASSDYGQISEFLLSLLRNALMIQSWFPSHHMEIYAISWYVSTIMFLYALTPFLIHIGKKIIDQKNGRLFTMLIILSCTLLIFAITYFPQNIDRSYWFYIFPPARLGEFIIGIALGFLYNTVSIEKVEGKTTLFTILEISILLILPIIIQNLPCYSWGFTISYWLIPNIMLISIFMFGKGSVSKLFSTKPLVALGNATFEMYIIHKIFINYFNTSPNTHINMLGDVVFFSISLGLTIIASLYLKKKA